MKSMSRIWLRMQRSAAHMLDDCTGIAATEFAVIAPVMLLMFFGTVEISTGVAVDRKVSLVARTLADLTSQTSVAMGDTDMQNVFTASIAVVKPYLPTPTKATLSEIYIDSKGVAKVQWSKAATIDSDTAKQSTLAPSSRIPGDIITTVPAALLQATQTYVIFSEVSYLYTPAVGYVMGKAGVTLSDVAYSRPRQVTCVIYNNLPVSPAQACPNT